MKTINKFLFEKLQLNKQSQPMQKLDKPTQGEHDKSLIYDDIWNDIKDHLVKWGAGPVYGWKGKQGVAFSVSEGKNVKPDDWIVIQYNKGYDDFTIFLSKYGAEEDEYIRARQDMIYAGQEPEVIDRMLGIK